MNNQSFERQLQQLDPPAADPLARLRARRAAVAEFGQVHATVAGAKAPVRRWNGPWVGGLAAASVASLAVAIFWRMPADEREVAPLRSATDSVRTAQVAEAALENAPAAVPPATVATEPAPDMPAAAPRVAGTPAPAPAQVQVQVPQSQSPVSAPKLEEPVLKSEDVELDSVQVTGTRIHSPSVTSASPLTSITGEEMRRLGIVNAADALAMNVPQQTAERQQSYAGNNIANSRGLDPTAGSRTLTLVDGRRVVSTSNQADVIDLNVIPPGLLQRMDVVTGGASAAAAAVYPPGVAGVVLVPQTVAPPGDQFEEFETNTVKSTADEPVSTFSVDVDTTSYSFVRRMLNAGQLPHASAVRAEEMINYFDYAWPAPRSRQQPFLPTVTVSDSPWDAGRKLVHVAIKGYELDARTQPDANLVLLLDVSGSMSSPDKLPLVKQSMKLLLDSLKPTDTVSIVVYAGAAGQVLAPTPVRDRETIEAALDGLRPGGSTAGAQGIRLAYELAQRSFRNGGVNRILLATDGDFNVGVSDPGELTRLVERERGRGVYLSVLGFGQGNYRDDIAQALAQNGNGVAAYIDTLGEARKVLVREATSSLFTIAGDVKIQVEFNPATVAEYRLVGYETRALNREDFNNDKVDAGDVGSGRAVTAIYEITPVGSLSRQIDESRYADARSAPVPSGATDVRPAPGARGKANEYGFVKLRYKLPGQDQSRLVEQPIRIDAGVPRALREDVTFSTAVAGFAQLLRGGRYTGTLTYEDVLRQAAASRGEDPYGYRAEFLELVRRAQQSAAALAARE